MAKILILYYSRTGTTKKVAEFIKGKLLCDIEEIIGIDNRSGLKGYMLCGKEATKKIAGKIQPVQKDMSEYDLVIIGTPIWAWNLSSTVRAALEQNKNKFKKISAFCTMGGSGDDKAFSEIEKICGKKLLAKLALPAINVTQNKFQDKADAFIEQIKNNQ